MFDRIPIGLGLQLTRDRRGDVESAARPTRDEAITWLSRAARDRDVRQQFRALLSRSTCGDVPVSRLSDSEVIAFLARLVVRGEIAMAGAEGSRVVEQDLGVVADERTPEGGEALAAAAAVGVASQAEEPAPRFELKVAVVDHDDRRRFIAGLAVEVAALPDGSVVGEQPSATEAISFERLSSGKYRVKLSLDEEQKKLFRVPEDEVLEKEVDLQADDEAEFRLVPVLPVHLKLQFRDPEGQERIFAEKLLVQFVFEEGDPIDAVVGKDGLVHDKEGEGAEPFVQVLRSKKTFTLRLNRKGTEAEKRAFVVCEKWGEKQPTQELVLEDDPFAGDTDLRKKIDAGARAFMLPKAEWTLKNSDWAVAQAPTWAPGAYRFEALDNLSTKIGDAQAPAVLTLDPGWQVVRFEYFDRYFGESGHDEKPISSLPLALEGYGKDVRDAEHPPIDELSTFSNWTAGKKELQRVQALPWILRADANNKELGFPDQKSLVRFKTDEEHRFIKATAKDRREYAKLERGDADHAPGVERLRYYDLPEEWRSTQYFCRLATEGNDWLAEKGEDQEFFEELARKTTTLERPLVFSLDDIVLTDSDLAPVAWRHEEPEDEDDPNDRVAVFKSTFVGDAWGDPEPVAPVLPAEAPPPPAPAAPDLGAGAAPARTPADPPAARRADLPDKPQGPGKLNWHSPQGLFRHDKKNERPYFSRIEMKSNYLADTARWTRAVAAKGNLFDVFDKRTKFDTAKPKTTVGARAGVRWVDVTAAGVGVAAGADKPARDLVKHDDHPYFSIHPYYTNEFFARTLPRPGANLYDEEASPIAVGDGTFKNGRADLALLRCSGRENDVERATLLQLHRFTFDFDTDGDNEVAGDEDAQKEWRSNFMADCASRWSGNDTANASRTFLVPTDAANKFKAQVVTFLQSFEVGVDSNQAARCHFEIKLVKEVGGGGSKMNAGKGTGQLRALAGQDFPAGRGFAAAHETGHAHAMPDDYPSNASVLGQKAWGSNHIPGSPFDLDKPANAQSMMKYNKAIRPRYAWNLTEWLRRFDDLAFDYKVVHGAEDDFRLPHHPDSDSYPGRGFAFWPLRARTRYHTPNTVIYDSYLYKLGKEVFSESVLPGAPVDGILVVLVHLSVSFQGYFAAGGNQARRERFARQLHTLFNGAVNRKIFAEFNLDDPAVAGDPRKFDKCYVHFLLRFRDSISNGRHVAVVVHPGRPSMTYPANGDKRDFRISFPAVQPVGNVRWNAAINTAANSAGLEILSALGLSVEANAADAGDYRNADSYEAIVQSVIGNGIDPTMTRV